MRKMLRQRKDRALARLRLALVLALVLVGLLLLYPGSACIGRAT